MTTIQLDLEPGRRALYEAALSRLPGVGVGAAGRSDALVTGHADAAGTSSVPCLLDQPELVPSAQLSALLESPVMPAHQWRFSPNVLPVQESNSSGQLGSPGLLRIHHWLGDEDGQELHSAFAQIDLAHWFFGETPTHTFQLVRKHYLQVHLGFLHGGMALIDIATHRPGGNDYFSLHLIGSTGAAYADDHRDAHLLFDESGSRTLPPHRNEVLTIQNMLQEFLSGIERPSAWSVKISDSVSAFNTLKEAAHV